MASHTDLSDKELKKSYWLLTHKERVSFLFVRTLIGLNCLLFFILTIELIFFIIQEVGLGGIKQNLLFGRSSHPLSSPVQEINSAEAVFLQRSNDTIDIVLPLTNTNDSWRVRTTIVFTVNNKEQRPVSLVLFPHETRHALLLGISSTSSIPQISYRIENSVWERMTSQDKKKFSQSYQFVVENIKFIPLDTSSQDTGGTSRLTFDVRNASVYNFWEVQIPVVVRQGSQVVGAGYALLPSFHTGDIRSVEIKWFMSLASDPSLLQFDIQPSVDVLDTRVYQPIEGVTQNNLNSR